jgi:hypothetical protein
MEKIFSLRSPIVANGNKVLEADVEASNGVANIIDGSVLSAGEQQHHRPCCG